MTSSKQVLFFDGVCNLCNGLIRFIIKRDPNEKFIFAALQSDEGQQKLKELNLETNEFDSFMLLKNEKVYFKSTAACLMFRELSGLWPFLYWLIIFPRPIRDYIYSIVAKNRYKWFGKKDTCMLPSPEVKSRFIN